MTDNQHPLSLDNIRELVTKAPVEPGYVKNHFIAGVLNKEIHLDAGMTLLQHKHKYDHMSVLASGTARVITDTSSVEYTAPAIININARLQHGIYAVTDVVWMCLRSTTDSDWRKSDEEAILVE